MPSARNSADEPAGSRSGVGVLLLVTAQLGVLNMQMAQAAPEYRNAGLDEHPLAVRRAPGRHRARLHDPQCTEQRWARRYFGADSRLAALRPRVRRPRRPHGMGRRPRHELTRQPAGPQHHVLLPAPPAGRSVPAKCRAEQRRPRRVVRRRHGRGTWHVVSWQRPIDARRPGGPRARHADGQLAAKARSPGEYRQPAAGTACAAGCVDGLNAMRPGSDPNPALSRSLLASATSWRPAEPARRRERVMISSFTTVGRTGAGLAVHRLLGLGDAAPGRCRRCSPTGTGAAGRVAAWTARGRRSPSCARRTTRTRASCAAACSRWSPRTTTAVSTSTSSTTARRTGPTSCPCSRVGGPPGWRSYLPDANGGKRAAQDLAVARQRRRPGPHHRLGHPAGPGRGAPPGASLRRRAASARPPVTCGCPTPGPTC